MTRRATLLSSLVAALCGGSLLAALFGTSGAVRCEVLPKLGMPGNCSLKSQDGNHDSASLIQMNVRNADANSLTLPIPKTQSLHKWIQESFPSIPVLSSQHTVAPLEFVLEQGLASTSGLWLEFGVWHGTSINLIAKHVTLSKRVYGFDSFIGLPEDFAIDTEGKTGVGTDGVIQKDAFDMGGKLPQVPSNVKLVKGFFNETLPGFLAQHPNEIVSLLHVDSDLYSSASFIFQMLGDRLHSGAIIVFDELVNFPDYHKHEVRALYEFLKKGGRQAAWIGSKCPVELTPKIVPQDVSCCATAMRLL